jgi:D-alanyl-D-alanine carboxypeptidase
MHEFVYDGEVIGNHDHLLGRVDGVDGIKTGYTRASGFNLLTSVHRDGRALVAVVMGGRSAPARDRLMERMIGDHMAEASTAHTATRIAESTPESYVPPMGRQAGRPAPVLEREEVADLTPPRTHHIVASRGEGDDSDDGDEDVTPPARIEKVADAQPIPPTRLEKPRKAEPKAEPEKAPPSAKELGWVKGKDAATKAASHDAPKKPDAEETRVARSQADDGADDEADDEAPKAGKGGWMIQIGATDDPDKARDLMTRARAHSRKVAALHGFTEKVRKDGDTLYRVRFAGLEQTSAEKACRDLRQGGLPCFTAHDD